MREAARARVAAVVAAASQRKSVSCVVDHAAGERRDIQARVNARGVAGFDHSTSSQFSGPPPGALLTFHDDDDDAGNQVQLSLNGAGFFGFDFDSSQHFSGTVAGNVVLIFDYQTSAHYKFSA
jgi:hypothetical protein